MKKHMSERKYIYLGIIGAILFGIGDWLLGYVDVTPITGTAFEYIRAGHGAGYDTLRAIAAMVTGTVGLLFYYPALTHMGDVVKDEASKSRLNHMFGAGAFAWLLIHYFYGVNVFCYSWMMQNGGEALAGELSAALGNAMQWGVAVGYIPLALPNVIHLIDIIRGKTNLKKSAAFFHPLVWIVIFNIVGNALPASPFSYGFYTFCMNAGMLVWFAYMAIVGSKNESEMKKSC